MTDGLPDDSDVRLVLSLLEETPTGVDGLTDRLALEGWPPERVQQAVHRATDSGQLFEDCRGELQPAPSHTV